MKNYLIVIVSLFFSLNIFAQALDSPAATVELVQREIITKKSLDDRYEKIVELYKQQGINPSVVSKKDVLNSIIQEMLLVQGATRDKVSVPDATVNNQVKMILKNYSEQANQNITEKDLERILGMPIANIKEQLKRTELLKAYILKKDPKFMENSYVPTEAEINKKFSQMKNSGALNRPAFLKIHHIFVNTQGLDAKNKAEALKTLNGVKKKILNKELSFEDAAKIYSEDKDSKYNGGDLDWVPYGDKRLLALYSQADVDQLFELNNGDLSDVVTSSVGYHLIKIYGKENSGIPKISDKLAPSVDITYKDRIKEALIAEAQKEKQDKILKSIYDSLEKEAEIKIFIKDLE